VRGFGAPGGEIQFTEQMMGDGVLGARSAGRLGLGDGRLQMPQALVRHRQGEM